MKTAQGGTQPSQTVLDIAVLRAGDLEGRELETFARLQAAGRIRATAIGDIPTTPYGITGLAMEVQVRPSVAARLERLPLGGTVLDHLQRRGRTPPRHSPGLRRALADFDVVNTRETFHAQSARAAALVIGRPKQRLVVSCFENVAFRHEENSTLAHHKGVVRGAADLFVANSPGAARALEAEGVPPARVRVVPPAVDTDRFTPGPQGAELRERWGVNPDQLVILYAGRLLSEKGVTEMILALEPVLRAATGQAKLVVQGSGGEAPRLRRVVAARGLEEHVIFADWVAASQMPDVYRSSDIVVLPSRSTPYWSEQFGFNLAEAMSCGRPIVGAATGEIRWVIGQGGIVVDVENPDAISAAVRRLLESRDVRMALGEAARAEAIRRFSVDTAGEDLLAAFRFAAESPKRGPAVVRG